MEKTEMVRLVRLLHKFYDSVRPRYSKWDLVQIKETRLAVEHELKSFK